MKVLPSLVWSVVGAACSKQLFMATTRVHVVQVSAGQGLRSMLALQSRPGVWSSGSMAEGAAVPRNDVLEKVEWKVKECILIGGKGFFSGTRGLRC